MCSNTPWLFRTMFTKYSVQYQCPVEREWVIYEEVWHIYTMIIKNFFYTQWRTMYSHFMAVFRHFQEQDHLELLFSLTADCAIVLFLLLSVCCIAVFEPGPWTSSSCSSVTFAELISLIPYCMHTINTAASVKWQSSVINNLIYCEKRAKNKTTKQNNTLVLRPWRYVTWLSFLKSEGVCVLEHKHSWW